MTRLPDFRLENVLLPLGVHRAPPPDRLRRPDHDARRAARAGRRRRPGRLERRCPSATPRPSATRPCGEAIAETYEQADADDVICFAGAEEALYLAMHVLLGAGDHAVVVTPNYQAAETVPLALCEVTGVALDPDRDWALDLDAGGRGDPAEHPGGVGQLPQQPDRQGPRRRRLRPPGPALRRARHPPVQRRGLPRPGTRPGPHPAAGRRPVRARAVAERDLEVPGAARAADRLDHLPRPRAARPAGAGQALHHDLQLRAQRGPGPYRPQGPRARSWTATGP